MNKQATVMNLRKVKNVWPGAKPALVALLAVLALGLALAYAARGGIGASVAAAGRQQAQLVSQAVVEPHLSERDLRRGLSRGRRRALDRAVGSALGRQGAELEIWGQSLDPLYSSPRGVARRRSGTAGLRKALMGRVGSRVVSGRVGRVLEVSMPLRGGDGQILAALEVGLPYSRVASGADRSARFFFAELAGGLALLYLALLAVIGVTARQMELRALRSEEAAHRDPLTRLPNRALFQQLVERALLVNRRGRTLVAVMVMDLDRFKEINDTLGHFNGDQLLERLAGRLRSVMRDADTIARLGGDEFAILMPDMPSQGSVRSATQRILKTMEEPFVVGGIALQVQGSIGIALSPQHGDRAEALLQAADVAMYVAKRAQSRFAFYAPEQHHHTPDRLALVAELRRATDAGEMVVHYQPQADLATGKVLRAEALLRWVHPRRGLITPDEFIPLAEQVGLMRPLTLHVLGTALMQCRAWRDDGMNVGVGVNLSTQNLLDLQFPDDLARLLAKSKVPPSMIELEITEGTIMSDPRRALSVLGRLRSMGVKLAVDDFGTGYSSLAYLKDLPVNTLKIDKSFVLEMEESPDDAAIVHSTVDLARNLGLDVVAEGVENERVWRRLADYGCTLAQGYFLSKPLAAPEFTGWLAARGEPDTPATAAETAA